MCVICGCSGTETPPPPTPHPPHADDAATGTLHYGLGEAKVSVPGMSQARAVKIESDILGANNRIASANRSHFGSHGVTALNFVSSPGSGKTTLLCETIMALKAKHPHLPIAVIEGDQQTSFDAERIRATGVEAIQVNTGKGCHLDAPMVSAAFGQLQNHHHAHGQDAHPHSHQHSHAHHHDHNHDHDHGHEHEHEHDHEHSHEHHHHHHDDNDHAHEGVHHPHPPASPSLLLIENVGNLVCPAMWDLGEQAKIAVLSVTEGEDKPLKYPDMFAASSLMILNKIDLLPHVQFDVNRCIDLAKRVNPNLQIIQLSATTGQGMASWLHWLEHAMGLHHPHPHPHPSTPSDSHHDHTHLHQQINDLQTELAQLKQMVQKLLGST